MLNTPDWLAVAGCSLLPIIEHTVACLQERQDITPHDKMPSVLAAFHLHQSIRASISSNNAGHHSVAVSLLRQCIESFTIVEIGLLSPSAVSSLLDLWRKDKGHGALRKRLQVEIWSSYGLGLWGEPWEQYFGNLAAAVQSYAHYTELLMGWQYVLPAVVKDNPDDQGTLLNATFGLDKVDSVKLLRLQLFQALVGWTLARVLEENNFACPMHGKKLEEWGAMIRSSELFDNPDTDWKDHWKEQFLPFLWFKVDNWKA